MPSFLDKLRSGSGTGTSTSSSGPGKKDGKEEALTWLQKLQQDPDPIRIDGGDKFFGAENFGNTCYCNSMVQSLYYSVPFREMMLSYPIRTPIDAILNDSDGNPRKIIKDTSQTNGQQVTSPKKTGAGASTTPAANPPRPSGPGPLPKPEDKESADYKKKQAMLNGPVLNLDYDNAAAYGMNPSLFTGLKDAFEAVAASSSRTGVVSMTRFLETLRQDNDMFRSPMHQDAHEFLNLLLNGVIEGVENHTKELEKDVEPTESDDKASLKKSLITAEESKKRHGEFQRLFQGTLTSETKCLTCENVSQRDEPFLDLSVDLEQHSSVTSCLRQFSEEEMLCERDKFFCDKCGGLQEAEKRMKVKRLPRILALHLKRFKYTEDLQRLQKLFHRVVYPYHLRLFNTTDDSEDPDKLYELYAVVVHIGSGPYHGHYVSIIKTPNRGWLLFDDELVVPVDKSFVKNFFGAQVGMACAYVLFYQETTLEAVKKEQEEEGLAAAAAAAEARQPVAKETKESYGLSLGLKINGITGNVGSPPNRNSHEEDMSRLTQVASAPAGPQSPSMWPATSPVPPLPDTKNLLPDGNAVTKVVSVPPTSPALPTSKADKKQAAKEEKERKAAEKEREKAEKAAEKARRKSMETRSKVQAAAVRSTINARKIDRPSSVGSATVDGSTSPPPPVSVPTQSLSPPAIPITITTTNTSSRLDGDEIAPAPLPNVMSPVLDNKAAATTQPATSVVSSTAASSSTPPPSAGNPSKDSGWNKPNFGNLSLRRSSKSLGRKSKLWDRFSTSEAAKSGAAGSGALPTGTPTSHPSASAPASEMLPPNAQLSAQAAVARLSNDFAVDDTDSGAEQPDRELSPRPLSKDGYSQALHANAKQKHLSASLAGAISPHEDGRVNAGSTSPAALSNMPSPSDVGTEVTPGSSAGGKRRGFSSIRKKASSLLS